MWNLKEGKRNSHRRASLLSTLWNKELRRYMGDLAACRTREVGQGKVIYLSFKVKDHKLSLSRQPKMTVEFAAAYENNCTASVLRRSEGKTPACKKKSIFLVFS